MTNYWGREEYETKQAQEAVLRAVTFLHELPEALEAALEEWDEMSESQERKFRLMMISIEAMVSHLSEAADYMERVMIAEQGLKLFSSEETEKPNLH